MLTGFLCHQCYGQQQCHTRLDQAASDIWPTCRETEGCCFACSNDFSCDIHSFCEFKESYETKVDERNYFVFFIGTFLLGSLASLGIHEYTPQPEVHIQCSKQCTLLQWVSTNDCKHL